MAETAALPLHNQSALNIHPLKPSSSTNETPTIHPSTSNINAAETSLIDSTDSYCLHQETRIESKYTRSAYVRSFMLFWIAGCCLCFCIPFFLDSFTIQHVYCQKCQKKLCSITRNNYCAHLTFFLLVLVGCGSGIYIVQKVYFRHVLN